MQVTWVMPGIGLHTFSIPLVYCEAPAPSGGNLLKEDGDALLKEDGDNLELED